MQNFIQISYTKSVSFEKNKLKVLTVRMTCWGSWFFKCKIMLVFEFIDGRSTLFIFIFTRIHGQISIKLIFWLIVLRIHSYRKFTTKFLQNYLFPFFWNVVDYLWPLWFLFLFLIQLFRSTKLVTNLLS